jgi:hypothetical protein
MRLCTFFAEKILIQELTREQMEITPDTTQEKASEKPNRLQ